ncbi:probable thiopurine S-methyltransferase [Physella acuta]|uniref:probable thiopurine S-methyltransferase n=1 Tax=Physella acuta TaxID=109671 RepID=UPI0027DDE3D7|nr:probable thiopurine S-methyltransferase [Physella acuta]
MSTAEADTKDRMKVWSDRWRDGDIGFHDGVVNRMLVKHLTKLIPEGKANKVFFPLCGKTVDMSWLASQGYNVVGVDGVKKALEDFFNEQNIEYSVEDVHNNGKSFQLLKSKDGQIRLYCTDIFNFTHDVEGTFDAVWDKGSLVALNREDVSGYVENMKKLLSPNGRILLMIKEYDAALMKDVEWLNKPPPPYPMSEDEIKTLYGPKCEVHLIQRDTCKVMGKEFKGAQAAVYNIIKK